jgi:diguanylate cyclase (GGDEF)-like protein
LDRRKKKTKTLFFSLLFVGFALSFFVLFLSYRNRLETVRMESIEQMQSAVSSTIEVYGRLAEMAFDETAHRPEIRELYLKAQGSIRPGERAFWRGTISRQLEPTFRKFAYYQLRLLNLVTPDGTVFLRMHDPDRYGDNVLPASRLQAGALKNRTPARGFEIGTTHSLYRYSFPLFLGNAFLGSAEFGLSSSAVLAQLKKQFPGHYTLLLRKDIVDPLLNPSAREKLASSTLSEKFYEDLQVKDLPDPMADPDPETQALILEKVREQASSAMDEGKSFTLFTQANDRPYAASFLRIPNPGGIPFGYIVAINWNPKAQDLQQLALTVGILMAGLFLIFAAFLRQGIRNHEKLIEEALYDALTGGLKQARFDSVAAREVSMAQRFGMPLSLVIFDLDHFKHVNDHFGHLKGDAVLRATGATVTRNIRRVDYFFRWGGDEFLIVLPNTNIDGALCAAEKIRALMENLNPDGVEGISISAGVAQMNENDADLRAVMKRADEALYRAKEKGRNNVSA